MDIQWVEVDGYPNYVVSNKGDVVSLRTGKPLTPRPNSEGYLRVALSNGGQVRDFYLNQLVAQAFFHNWHEGVRVQYVNGDKNDNSIWNLRLKQGDTHGETPRRPGEREPWGRRVKVVETGEVFASVRDLARAMNGDYSSIYAVLRGERRHHKGFTFEFYKEW